MSRPRENPGAVASTRNIDSDRVPAPGSVTAVTWTTSAKWALVIQALVPSRIQSEPSRRARVSIARTSVPTEISVLANAAVISPAISGSSHCSRAASEQCSIAGFAPSVQPSAARPRPSPECR